MVTTVISKMLSGLLLLCTGMVVAGQNMKGTVEANPCLQNAVERDRIINDADQKLNTWRVELVGNTYSRFREFRKRFVNGIGEGDIFSRRALEETIINISKMKAVYPITLNDVEVRNAVHPTWKIDTINISFCVRQKPERHWYLL